MDYQFRKASNIPRSDLLRTRARSKRKLFPFVTTFNPNLPDIGRIIRKDLAILEPNPKLKELFPPNSIIASFRRSKNLKELLAPSRYGSNTEHEEAVEVATFWLNQTPFEVFKQARVTRYDQNFPSGARHICRIFK